MMTEKEFREFLMAEEGIEVVTICGEISIIKKDRHYQWIRGQEEPESIRCTLREMADGDEWFKWINGSGAFIKYMENYLSDGGGEADVARAMEQFKKEMT
jgi:hypothetical protein